jgi:hypothetical protein
MAQVTATIADSNNVPYAYATVIAKQLSGAPPTVSTTTNVNGNFTVNLQKNVAWVFSVNYSGASVYYPASFIVTIIISSTTYQDLTLQMKPLVPVLIKILAPTPTPGSSGVITVNGVNYPNTAVGINAADSALGINAGEIYVSTPGSYCDTTVLLSNLHTLDFAPGTYVMNIAGADSSTANVTWGVVGEGGNQVTLQSCPGSNKDVITSQHFSSFTGGTNFYGVYRPVIRGLTIDGNKGSETAGFGIRIYGRAPVVGDILTQNCYQDGQWWEWGGTESDTGSGTSVNATAVVLESDYNGGNGFTFQAAGASAGSLNAANNLIAHNNGAWGIQQYYTLSVGQINSYNNTSGACDMKSGGLIATNVECNAAASGWGLKQESGAGGVFIGSGLFSGGIPFESDTTSGGFIQANFSNPAAASPCIKINGGGSLNIIGTGFGCSTAIVAFTSELTPNFITFNHAGSTTLYTGTPTSRDYVNIIASGGTQYFQLPNAIVTVNGYSPILPTSNGTLLSSSNTDTHFQYASAAGCTTGSSAGNGCASAVTITWTTSFADTSYVPVCSGSGIASGVPSGPYVVTQSAGSMTVNYFAITASAAAYTTVNCWAVHN